MKKRIRTPHFGERDDYLLQRFATGDDKLRTLLTLLNKEISGENYDTMSRWFYETFDVQHGKNYGPVSISSSFGNKGFSVRLYPSNANKEESYLGTPIQQVIQFSQTIQQGLPQMEIKPVSMRSYLDTLHDSLQFSSR